MPSEKIAGYEIEYSGVLLPNTERWAAYLNIYGPSCNPMHRNNIFKFQRVLIEQEFPNEAAAEQAALSAARGMLKKS
ncbi:hypothetical protein [Glaciimonas soli]|uniref:Uncharacterized protein n=1 Tax=Glaciimonas soli TaxID=2590999 RepID=A0A843YSX1_9BURK|nr:hypothetical protein [Glaciimonas soli]MQQ99775.1 hypothetical protein [Glaciimonas soli]